MRALLMLLLLLEAGIAQGQKDTVTINGRITDFSGQPVAGAWVIIKGKDFGQFVDSTYSDKSGAYSLRVAKGRYSGLAAVRMDDYGKSKLEFWAYEIPAYNDLTIDARYHRLEVYGVNVFQVQGAYPGYTLYFRPMSLTRYLDAGKDAPEADIAPPADQVDIRVFINGERVRVNSIQRVEEYTGQQPMYAYLVQTELGKPAVGKYDEFLIVVEDKVNGDKGEAKYFLEKINYE